MPTLMKVSGLATQFFTEDGVVKAVDGIEYDLEGGRNPGPCGRERVRQERQRSLRPSPHPEPARANRWRRGDVRGPGSAEAQ